MRNEHANEPLIVALAQHYQFSADLAKDAADHNAPLNMLFGGSRNGQVIRWIKVLTLLRRLWPTHESSRNHRRRARPAA